MEAASAFPENNVERNQSATRIVGGLHDYHVYTSLTDFERQIAVAATIATRSIRQSRQNLFALDTDQSEEHWTAHLNQRPCQALHRAIDHQILLSGSEPHRPVKQIAAEIAADIGRQAIAGNILLALEGKLQTHNPHLHVMLNRVRSDPASITSLQQESTGTGNWQALRSPATGHDPAGDLPFDFATSANPSVTALQEMSVSLTALSEDMTDPATHHYADAGKINRGQCRQHRDLTEAEWIAKPLLEADSRVRPHHQMTALARLVMLKEISESNGQKISIATAARTLASDVRVMANFSEGTQTTQNERSLIFRGQYEKLNLSLRRQIFRVIDRGYNITPGEMIDTHQRLNDPGLAEFRLQLQRQQQALQDNSRSASIWM